MRSVRRASDLVQTPYSRMWRAEDVGPSHFYV